MFVQVIDNTHSAHKVKPQYLLSLVAAFAFAFAISPTKAQAQVTDDLQVTIPFQFHAGNAKLPAGDYRVHVMDDSGLAIMEISSVDASASAIFQVRETDAKTTPDQSELIFNKYGDRYFLADVFEAGESSGSQVLESQYEKQVSKDATQGQTQAQEHVPAHRGSQRGK
jgi:hypothetical protein